MTESPQRLPPKKIFISAGEPSGDIHASNLVRDLNILHPGLQFFGLGGRLSREAGVNIEFDISALALVGVTEVLKNIVTIAKVYKALLRRIDLMKPDLAILVDYPGFNLRLAKELNKRNIPVVYYISPQVWAWGKNRIDLIKRYVKKVVVFFKFEEELYKANRISAEFVGHPLLDVVRPDLKEDVVFKKYGLSKNSSIISLLPGSRRMEVNELLGVMIGAAMAIDKRTARRNQFLIAKHRDLPASLYEEALRDHALDAKIVDGDTYNILSVSDFAIVASGTATLEAAILGVPFIITYKGNVLTYAAYKILAKSCLVGLVNVIAGREIVPEFLQFDATPDKLAEAAVNIMENEKRSLEMREALKDVVRSLGSGGARLRAAKAIASIL